MGHQVQASLGRGKDFDARRVSLTQCIGHVEPNSILEVGSVV
jgi:hypothetical protein